jgi:TIGR00255 family protein
MTGFGHGTATGTKGIVTAEIKTVNNRFLELNIRTDHFSAAAEESIKSLIKEQVHRGKIYVNLIFTSDGSRKNIHVSLDEDLLSAYLDVFHMLRHKDGIRCRKPSVSDLLSLPAPFLHVAIESITDEELISLAREAVSAALAGVNEMRRREGENLAADLNKRAADLNKRIDLLREKLLYLKSKQNIIVEDYEKRLRSRMIKLLEDSGNAWDETRLLQEVAVYSEKTDYTEELTRFESHLNQFAAALDSTEPIGRKLDFLLQEINREINTTASKANDISVIDCVIIIKTELEKIREQVQNIE